MIFCNECPKVFWFPHSEWIYVEFINRDGRIVQGPYKSNVDLLLLRHDLVLRHSLSAENVIFHYMKTSDLALAGKMILNNH